jgi:hypothetical protein
MTLQSPVRNTNPFGDLVRKRKEAKRRMHFAPAFALGHVQNPVRSRSLLEYTKLVDVVVTGCHAPDQDVDKDRRRPRLCEQHV